VKQLWLTLAEWITPPLVTGAPSPDTVAPAAPEKAITDDWPPLPGIDTAIGLHTLDHNHKLYRKLLLRFCQTQANFQSDFLEAQQSTDATAATRCAHTLKGLAATLGMTGVQQAAQALEQACKTRQPQSEIETHWRQVIAQLQPVLQAFRRTGPRHRGSRSAEASAPGPGRSVAQTAATGDLFSSGRHGSYRPARSPG
jgi:two-component system sensor histidine kinase/response regulator